MPSPFSRDAHRSALRCTPLVALMLLACAYTALAQDQDATKKEMARLEGEWSMVFGEIGGQSLPPDYGKSAKRLCKGNETTIIMNGMTFFKANITIDPTKQPKTIDYAMTEGFSKGSTQLGIYDWNGDTVRFCFGAPGKERPTDFTTKAGDDRTLSAWKKVK